MYFVMLVRACGGAIPRGFFWSTASLLMLGSNALIITGGGHARGDQLLVALNSQVVS